jgi:hypothetical protein
MPLELLPYDFITSLETFATDLSPPLARIGATILNALFQVGGGRIKQTFLAVVARSGNAPAATNWRTVVRLM